MERIKWFDVAKGLGILSVIIGHMHIWKFHSVIYSFHMPLFFLISGYLMSFRYTKREYIKHKFSQLIIPYTFTCLCLIVLVAVIDIFKSYSISDLYSDLKMWFLASLYGSGNIEPVGIHSIGAIWFLLALFIAQTIVYSLCNNKYACLVLSVIGILGYVSSRFIWLPMSLQVGMVASVYVYLGSLAKKMNLMDQKMPTYIIILMSAVWLATICFGSVNMAKNEYNPIILSFIGPITAVYLILRACKSICQSNRFNGIVRILCFYGKNSLVILCFHLLELNLVPWGGFRNNLQSCGLNIIIIFFIMLFIKIIYVTLAVYLINHIKLLRSVFYGNDSQSYE